MNKCSQSNDSQEKARKNTCFLQEVMNKEVINTDIEIKAIHEEVHEIKSASKQRDKKITILYWMGVASIILGMIKVGLELSGNFNG